MKSIIEFNQDIDTRNNVHAYLVSEFEKEAVKKVFAREDTSAIADAKELLDKAFENMDLLSSPKVKVKEQINQAR